MWTSLVACFLRVFKACCVERDPLAAHPPAATTTWHWALPTTCAELAANSDVLAVGLKPALLTVPMTAAALVKHDGLVYAWPGLPPVIH